MDRVITELKWDPVEAFRRIREVVDQVRFCFVVRLFLSARLFLCFLHSVYCFLADFGVPWQVNLYMSVLFSEEVYKEAERFVRVAIPRGPSNACRTAII